MATSRTTPSSQSAGASPREGQRENQRSGNQDDRRSLRDIMADRNLSGSEAAWQCMQEYAHERPEVVAMWTFGIGFVLGWKLKMW